MTRIKEVSIDKILPLRHRVLRPGRPVLTAHFDGDDDPGTIHLAVYWHDDLASCLTLMKRPLPDSDNNLSDQISYQLRGMATATEHRGMGCGTELLEKTEEFLIEKNAVLVWCNARIKAVPFYQKSGFEVISEEFEIEGIGPHLRLKKEIL
jgi:predicted GNAT family N-acyltransferase